MYLRCADMFVTNRLLLLLFFLAIRLLLIVDTTHAEADSIGYSEGYISVGSSVTADDASSWMSSSGRFSFEFYLENDNFSVGIQLLISPLENVIVWTARPDLKRFSKDAFLNFTSEGFFVTPEKGAKASLLFKFSSTATSADMLDDGNFVVYGNSRGCKINYYCRSASDNSNSIWRSFDFPTDTILHNQILPCGYNLTSSAGNTDHSIGNYNLNLPCDGASLISYQLNSSDPNWVDTGASVGDNSALNLDGQGRLYLISPDGHVKDLSVYKISTDDHMLYRATLDSDGFFRVYELNLNTSSSSPVNVIPETVDSCYQAEDICGVNSYCVPVSSKPQCKCMPGFEYIDQRSQFAGCQRNKTLPSCIGLGRAAAIFSMETVDNIVYMDYLAYDVVSTASREECSNACLSDCNCGAASFLHQKCLMLKLPLTSGRKDDSHPSVTFIKLAAGGQATTDGPHKRREIRFADIFISAAVTISIWLLVIAAFVGAYWLLFVRFREEWRKWELALTEEVAPRYFSYEELRKGSNEFNQPLGKGGHGTVYRAEMPIGDRTVAVALKKLHGAEIEGEREFQAEMSLIGRACHANLVRLLGFCHNGPSRILAYELMSRGSLANHIFESRGRRPSWERRMTILIDAARGIQYVSIYIASATPRSFTAT